MSLAIDYPAALEAVLVKAEGENDIARVCAFFLLSCKGEQNLGFELTELRKLDSSLMSHCITLLVLSYRRHSLCGLLCDGVERFARLEQRWLPVSLELLEAQA